MSLVENAAAKNEPPRNGASSAGEPRGRASVEASELGALLERLRSAHRKAGPPDYDARIEHLDKLERVVLARKHDLAAAVAADFGVRSAHETLGAEVMVVVNEIKHARAHLHEWMETEPREVTWMFLPGRAEVIMQPLGVVGIISPWNYPVQLALAPLVAALAAGNRVMLKPSELTPETGELLRTMMTEAFAPDHVSVVTGGLDVAEAFARLRFDHLLFTGSTRVGKLVMRAAAENLVPVTLELGGKSPVIVGEGYSLARAASDVMAGKLLNAGQTCVAPDFVMVPKGKADAFVEDCRAAVAQLYPRLGDNRDYTSIVDERHYARLKAYLVDAEERGAKLVELNPAKEELEPSGRKMAPTLVLHPKDEMLLMQEEIFGPILPVVTYSSLEEAIAYVNERPRPLALYVFENDPKRIDRILRETVVGGMSINTTLLHCAMGDLPFGGVGESGMGHYHGREGFETFTKKKPVFYQSRISGISLLRPPYGPTTDFVLKMLLGK